MNCICCGTKFESNSGRCPRCAWNPDQKHNALAGYLKGELVNDRYTVRESLGIGHLGVAIKAIDLKSNRAVALKIIHPALIPDDDAGTRFITGMQAIMANPHEGRAKLLDVGHDGNRYYYARELLYGATLRQLMEDQQICGQTFPLEEAVQIVQKLARALTSIKGAAHGGFSPSKVWVLTDKIMIVDHGLVGNLSSAAVWHLLRAGQKNNWYLAPELQDNRPPDTQSDVYSLAAILGEMLSLAEYNGRVEIFRESEPEFPREVEALLRCALSVDPDTRYFDAMEFVSALYDVSGQQRTLTMPPDNTLVVPSNFLQKLRSMSDMPPLPADEDAPVVSADAPWSESRESEPFKESDEDEDEDEFEVTRQVSMHQVVEDAEDHAGSHAAKAPPPKSMLPRPLPYRRPIPTVPPNAPLRPRRPVPIQSVPPQRPAASAMPTVPPAHTPSPHASPAPPRIPPGPSMVQQPSASRPTELGALGRASMKAQPPPPRPSANPHRAPTPAISHHVPVPAAPKLPTPPPIPTSTPVSVPKERLPELEGINPRFLRAAAKLEQAKTQNKAADSINPGESEEEWRKRLEETSSGSVISFLPPTTTDNPMQVEGFPKNQQRPSTPNIPPIPSARRVPPPPLPMRRK